MKLKEKIHVIILRSVKLGLLVCFLVWVIIVLVRSRDVLDSNVHVHVCCIFWWFLLNFTRDSVWLHAHVWWKEPPSHPRRKLRKQSLKPKQNNNKQRTRCNTHMGVNYHLYTIKQGEIDKIEMNVWVIQRNYKSWSWVSV